MTDIDWDNEVTFNVYGATPIEIDKTISIANNKYKKFMHLMYVHPDKKIRNKANKLTVEFSDKINSMMGDKKLYTNLMKMFSGTNPEYYLHQKYSENKPYIKLVTDILTDFKINDGLSSDIINYYKKLNELCHKFDTNIMNTKMNVSLNEKELIGCDYIPGTYDLSNNVIYTKLITYVDSEEIRKKIFLIKSNGIQENKKLITKICKLRKTIATMYGYKSWQEYTIRNNTIKTSKEIKKLIDSVKTQLLNKCKQELSDLEPFGLVPWNLEYTKRKFLQEKYKINITKLFPKINTIKKIMKFFEELLSIRIVPTKHGEIIDDYTEWEVKCTEKYYIYDLSDDRNLLRGIILLDTEPRPDKFTHAMCTGLIARTVHEIDAIPLAAVVMNTGNNLNLIELKTVIHELGHAFHHILGSDEFKYGLQSGLSGITFDFVEAPSQILENWISNPKFLQSISNVSLSISEARDIINTSQHFIALQWLKQLSLTHIDNFMHGPISHDYNSIAKEYDRVCKESGIPFHHSEQLTFFNHVSEYGGKYYTYLLSCIISCDFYKKFSDNPKKQKAVGKLYRTLVLEPAGTQTSMVIIKNFLGRKYSVNAFINSNAAQV